MRRFFVIVLAALFYGPSAIASVFDAPNAVDFLYDDVGEILYISTSDGMILRWDFATEQFLAPWEIGGNLGGLDISADGSALYVAQHTLVSFTDNGVWWNDTGQGEIVRIELSSGTVSHAEFTVFGLERGSADVAVANNGLGLITTDFAGSGWTPLRQVDTASLAISNVEFDVGYINFNPPQVRQSSFLTSSEDHRYILIQEVNISNGPLHIYDAQTQSVIASTNLYDLGTSGFNAGRADINSSAGLVASVTYNDFFVLDLNLNVIADLRNLAPTGYRGGVVFDPDGRWLYFLNGNTNEILRLDTSTWEINERFALEEEVPWVIYNGAPYGNLYTTGDGHYLFADTEFGFELVDVGGYCLPYFPADNMSVTCEGDWTRSLVSSADNTAITVHQAAHFTNPLAFDFSGQNVTLLNKGEIDGLVLFGEGDDRLENLDGGVIAGNVGFSGGNDALVLGAESVFTGVADGGSGEDLLVTTSLPVIDGAQFMNFELYENHGAIDLMLVGDLSFHLANIGPGRLRLVDGQLLAVDELIIGAGGALMGNGMVTGNVTNNGDISPGASFGSLVIAGDLILGAGARIVMEIGHGQSDTLAIGGDLIINGNELFIDTVERSDRFQAIDLISVGGTTIGSLSLATDAPYSAFNSLEWSGNSFRLYRIPTLLSLGSLNPNQTAIAEYFNRQLQPYDSNGLTQRFVDIARLTPAGQQAALDQVTPESVGSITTAAFTHARSILQSLESRPALIDQGTAKKELWIQGIGLFENIESDIATGASKYNQDIYGVIVGADLSAAKSNRLGLAASFIDGNTVYSNLMADVSFRGFAATAYGVQEMGAARILATASYGILDGNVDRSDSFGSVDFTARAKPKANFQSGSVSVFIQTGEFLAMRLQPFGSLAFSSVHRKQYIEEATEYLKLTVTGKSTQSLVGHVGARLSKQSTLGSDIQIRPEATFGMSYEFLDRDRPITARIADLADPFTVFAARSSKGRANLGAGITIMLPSGLRVYAGYDGGFANSSTRHDVTIRASMGF